MYHTDTVTLLVSSYLIFQHNSIPLCLWPFVTPIMILAMTDKWQKLTRIKFNPSEVIMHCLYRARLLWLLPLTQFTLDQKMSQRI